MSMLMPHEPYGEERLDGRRDTALRKAVLCLWWHSGALEATIGIWLMVEGVLLATIGAHGITVPIAIAMVLVCGLIPLVFSTIGKNLVVPTGAAIVAGQRTCAPVGQCVAAALVFICALAVAITRSSSWIMVVGVVIAMFLVVAWMASNMTRYMVLALIALGAFACATLAHTAETFVPMRCLASGVVITGVAGLVTAVVRSHVITKYIVDTFTKRSGYSDMDINQHLDALFCQEQYAEIFASQHWYARYLACEFLRFTPDSEAVPYLVRCAISDADQRVQTKAESALKKVWDSDSQEMLRLKLAALQATKKKWRGVTPEKVNAARKRFEHNVSAFQRDVENTVRTTANQDPDFVTSLIDLALLEEGDKEDMRTVAIKLLGSTHNTRAYDTLSWLLANKGRQTALQAAAAYQWATSAAVTGIVAHFDDMRGWVRLASISAAITLLESLRAKDPRDCAAARNALWEPLQRQLASASVVTRSEALGLYAQWGAQAGPYIEKALESKYALTRGKALWALCVADSDRVRLHIAQALDDASSFVRNCALDCAIFLNDASYVEKAQAMVEAGDMRVIERAQYYLMSLEITPFL